MGILECCAVVSWLGFDVFLVCAVLLAMAVCCDRVNTCDSLFLFRVAFCIGWWLVRVRRIAKCFLLSVSHVGFSQDDTFLAGHPENELVGVLLCGVDKIDGQVAQGVDEEALYSFFCTGVEVVEVHFV